MADIHIEQITPELTWRLRQNVLHPDCLMMDMALTEDDQGMHYGAFTGNKIIAVASVFAHGTVYRIRKLAIDPLDQEGVGQLFMAYIIHRIAESGATHVWSNAPAIFLEIYLEAGFTSCGEKFSKNGVDYIRVDKYL